MTTTGNAPAVGAGMDRVDGRLKVTGAARFSAEMPAEGLVHAVLVQSTVPAGRITRLDTAAARKAPGVLAVMTHLDAPKLPQKGRAAVNPPAGRVMTLLQDATVRYNGQPIAVVVADTFEHARDAAALVRARYDTRAATLDPRAAMGHARPPKQHGPPDPRRAPDSTRGDVPAGLAQAEVTVEETYTTPIENHNPMEPHATIARWDGDELTLYDATQYVMGDRDTVAKTLGIPSGKARVVSLFVGGGFGCKGSVWSHVPLAAMAARRVGRPVKLVLSRRQMFGPVGARPLTIQRLTLGATRDGALTAVRHHSVSHTSTFEDFLEPTANVTRMLYACPNVETRMRVVPLDVGTPTFQRAPGEATGTFALESAMDELAVKLGMDPLELRLRNYAEEEPQGHLPWSSKSLRQCYGAAAERFGWKRRDPKPGSMRAGDELVGWGMATATYPTNRRPAEALARLAPDGRGGVTALVRSATQDIGTGTYTIMTQIAADALGLPPGRVRFELGDSRFPPSPVSGGSMTAASTGSAVFEAARAARNELVRLATADPRSPLSGARPEDVRAENGRLFLASDDSKGERYEALLARHGGPVEGRASSEPGEEKEQFAMHAFGAVFVEARVDPDLGRVRIPRIVAAYSAGKFLNAKTARSQLMGGVVWGLGMALFEETLLDPRSGRVVNADLAEYHVPVNADVGEVDIILLDEEDPHVNPIGAKGIGEIGITGASAAVANAVWHATGVRVRDLPITLDKLLAAPAGGAEA
ncbi:MAG TPA: xanthine dehydrogenase family protein molybdopterin-binding subunit [Gemmatimonadales bacterium]|nr:xanthine dehydrogenase family protein molybdopterin-binding subunit [Gemmatimonadales bacterium]